jgi:mannose-6-phosphate isomerase
MTIAVTPFDGLCGFRPLAQITHFLQTVPSLRKLVGEDAAKEFESSVKGKETSDSKDDLATNKKALQTAFSGLMNADKNAVVEAAKELVASAQKEGAEFAGNGGPANDGQELADLVVRLNGQFEGDIGLFVMFFLNYVKLEIGEAMFLKADDIHAYLSGGRLQNVFRNCNEVLTLGHRHH